MSPQLVCVILLLHFHACFASRGLLAFHDNLQRPKEDKGNPHVQMKMKHFIEKMEGTHKVKIVKTTPVLGANIKLELQNKKRRLQERVMVEERATPESRTTTTTSSNGYNEAHDSVEDGKAAGEDIEVKDYAQPRRKPPIHNTQS